MRLVNIERVVCLVVIAYLQVKVYLVGVKFSEQAARVAQLPGVRAGLWVFGGRGVDLSDVQWRDFRGSSVPLGAALLGFVVISRLVQGVTPALRPPFYAATGLAFVGVLHGSCLCFVVTLALGNFVLSKWLDGRKSGLLTVWICNCAVLVLVRVFDGIAFASLSPSLAFMDQHCGMLRWHIHYNFLVLRMVSFGADVHWARREQRQQQEQQHLCGLVANKGQGQAPDVKHQPQPLRDRAAVRLQQQRQPQPLVPVGRQATAGSDMKARAELSLSPSQYSLTLYLAYLLYPPLYIAGPVVTYNAFASQLASPARPHRTEVLQYAGRVLLSWLLLEALTHTLYCNSFAKYRLWDVLRYRGVTVLPLHVAVSGYWVLLFMWLKFLLIWRFFRLFALADGVVVPENMGRCVCNNYDIEGFWRSWHASYNQWLVRYLYVPLGGARWRVVNVWVVFTFVALWHDLEWRLLGWAWIMALAMAPEVMLKRLAQTPGVRRWQGSWQYRHACAFLAALNITVLMVGNLVGFVVGVDGIVPLLREVAVKQPTFFATLLATFHCASLLMFMFREWASQRVGQASSKGAACLSRRPYEDLPELSGVQGVDRQQVVSPPAGGTQAVHG